MLPPVGGALLVILAVVVAFLLVSQGTGTSNNGGNGQITLEYSTELGQAATRGTVNSPLRITLRLPYTGIEEATVNTATVQLVDEAGNPAEFGGQPSAPLLLQATYELGVWAYNTSVPSKPGKYSARVQIVERAAGGELPPTQEYNFSNLVLEAMPEEGAQVTSGFVFTRDANLWILSTDATKQRRLTYFPSESEYANDAIWSPDGQQIAFAHAPQTDPSELPTSDIWVIKRDGTGAQMVVQHQEGESLYNPAFSADGKYLYFTAEKQDISSTNFDANGVPIGLRGIDRVDLATGERTHWKDDSYAPVEAGTDGALLYVGMPVSGGEENSAGSGLRLVREKPDGTRSQVLLDGTGYTAFYGLAASPDGSKVVFAGIESQSTLAPPTPSGSDFDLLGWLLFKPEVASAHGLPWDLFMVPANGGSKPVRLTNMAEDQPHPVWLDNSTVAFMGVTGLYKLELGADGNPVGEPEKIHDGAPHGGLTWYGP